jgi:hypothetical protein
VIYVTLPQLICVEMFVTLMGVEYVTQETYIAPSGYYTALLATRQRNSEQFAIIYYVYFICIVHGVHYAGLSDFSVRGTARRHFSRQVAQLSRRKFRR